MLLLVVMAGIGSILANRGIKLYAQGNINLLPVKSEKEEPSKSAESKTVEEPAKSEG